MPDQMDRFAELVALRGTYRQDSVAWVQTPGTEFL